MKIIIVPASQKSSTRSNWRKSSISSNWRSQWQSMAATAANGVNGSQWYPSLRWPYWRFSLSITSPHYISITFIRNLGILGLSCNEYSDWCTAFCHHLNVIMKIFVSSPLNTSRRVTATVLQLNAGIVKREWQGCKMAHGDVVLRDFPVEILVFYGLDFR